ncbi:MAG: transaldolase family protein [Simkaniaceae bacterium]|nr:transaldolase family protein [Simkaniaceae bacterium]
MDIWLDSVDIKTISFAGKLGFLEGVTTDPSLIGKSEKSLEENLDAILKAQSGPVTAQVTAVDHSTMIEQAETLREFSERIIVNIPVTQEGLKAMASLSHLQFPVMATAIFTPFQALLACHVGATYIAPYFSRMKEPLDTLEGILLTLDRYDFKTELIVASLKTPADLEDCLHLGVDAVTLREDLFETLIEDQSGTFEALDQFSKDWKSGNPSQLLP